MIKAHFSGKLISTGISDVVLASSEKTCLKILMMMIKWLSASEASHSLWCSMINRAIYIREYGSTLYVGLARAVSPTNTNFQLTFLLTRLQEALYEDLAV